MYEILSVNAGKPELELRGEPNEAGERGDTKLFIPPGVAIELNGKTAEVGDLRPGDQIHLNHRQSALERIRAIRPKKSAALEGNTGE